jgi:hypothetical protein
VPKLTNAERVLVKNLVATLSIKRIPDLEIIKEIKRQTTKTISRVSLFRIRQSIKRDSHKWYSQLREGEYEYIHEFKERISEIVDLQRRAHKVIEDNPNKPQIILAAIETLHRLNITLSNYFDVAPTIVSNPVKANDNNNTVSIPQKDIIV